MWWGGGRQKLPMSRKKNGSIFVLCNADLISVSDFCLYVFFWRGYGKGFVTYWVVLVEVSGAYVVLWGRQEGIINSSPNAPSIATSDRVHSSSLRRYIGILSQFSNSNSAEIDVYKKIRYISCLSPVLHCLVNNVCGKKLALLSEIHILVYHG